MFGWACEQLVEFTEPILKPYSKHDLSLSQSLLIRQVWNRTRDKSLCRHSEIINLNYHCCDLSYTCQYQDIISLSDFCIDFETYLIVSGHRSYVRLFTLTFTLVIDRQFTFKRPIIKIYLPHSFIEISSMTFNKKFYLPHSFIEFIYDFQQTCIRRFGLWYWQCFLTRDDICTVFLPKSFVDHSMSNENSCLNFS